VHGRSAGLFVTALLALACSASATVSGQVSAGSPSGLGGPEADVEVMLLNATEAFEGEWSRLVTSFASERALALLAADEAEAARGRAAADRSAASAAGLHVLLQRDDDVDWGAYDRDTERHRAAVERLLKAAQQRREAQSRLVEITRRYRREAWDLIRSHQIYRARTDASGRFAFERVAPGRYVLASRVPRGEGAIYWFIRVNPAPRSSLTVDLAPANAGWPFS
jgi:hypothetical protein